MAYSVIPVIKVDELKSMSGIDINKLSNENLKLTLQATAMHVNSRLRQLERSGEAEYSNAYNALKEALGGDPMPKLTSKGKSRASMIRELKLGINYLRSTTGTVSGTRDKLEYTAEILENAGASEEQAQQLARDKDFWSTYRRVSESIDFLSSEDLIQEVYDVLETTNIGNDDTGLIVVRINKKYDIEEI